MKRRLISSKTLACCFIFLIAVFADLNGKWTGVVKTPDGTDLQVTYNFKVDGDKLTGTAESTSGVYAIDSGKVSGDTFSFDITAEGNVYPHAGKFYEDSCGLDIDFGGQKAHATLTRVTDK